MYHFLPKCRKRDAGFALISSLALLILLLCLALATVQLSVTEQRISEHSLANAAAKHNARLALQIALSQIQHYTGRDQTVTCRADLLDSRVRPSVNNDPNIKHPYYTAAFQTESIVASNTNEGVQLRKVKKLPAYLVSGNEHFDLLSWQGSEYPGSYTCSRTPISNKLSLTISNTSVDVPKVELPNRGAYAYWVSDESCKARINTEDLDRAQNINLTQNTTHESQDFSSLRAPSQLRPLSLQDITEAEKNLTLKSITLHGDEHQRLLSKEPHAFTAYSTSVLTDLQNGGLKKNLTAAINLSDADFNKLIKHEGEEASQLSPVFPYQKWTFPPETEPLSYSHYAGVPWELIRSYVRRPEWEEQLTGEQVSLLSHLGDPAHKLPHYWQSSEHSYRHFMDARLIRRKPLLTRLQIGYDFSLEYQGAITEDDGTNWHSFALRQHFFPLAIFWNPYNVDLTVSEPIEFQLYLDRSNWGSNAGRHNTEIELTPANNEDWKVFSLSNDSRKEVPQWSSIKSGSSRFIYPFHTRGNTAPSSELCRLSFHTPTFSIPAGTTVVFSAPPENRILRYSRNTPNELNKGYSFGYSFYSKNAEIRIRAESNNIPQTPSLKILRYPTAGGSDHTRVQVTNGSSFQRINWNFADLVSSNYVTFIPQTIDDNDPLLSGNVNGTASPQFTAALIRKFPDISHHIGSSQSWITPSGKLNTNNFNAPWHLFFNSNASRYGAYGAHPSSIDIFSAPPQYLSGISLGDTPSIHPELTSNSEAFVGHSDSFATGVTHAIHLALPRSETRTISFAHLSQINTCKWLSGYNQDQSNASATDAFTPNTVIANSFLSPHIPPSYTKNTITDRHAYASDATSSHYDQSYIYNNILWDRYFLTGAQPNDMLDLTKKINFCPNKNLEATEPLEIEKWNDPHLSASQLLLRGGFNVNSTSIEAWKAVLSSTKSLQASDGGTVTPDQCPFPNLQYTSAAPTATAPQDTSNKMLYDGSKFRALSDDEIEELAKAVVVENKLRGPSATLSQWINRSLSSDHHYRKFADQLPLTEDNVCYEGTLQAAINRTSINGAFNNRNSTYPAELVADPNKPEDFEHGKLNVKALKYHSGYGAPGTLTQSDILQHIGHFLTARSDTFTIRAYGEHKNAKGEIIATAYCEAVVQRFPAYIDPINPPEEQPHKWQLDQVLPLRGKWQENPQLRELNKKSGRHYKITQFRWLHPREI